MSDFVVDPKYNPLNETFITSDTKLGPGITVGTFLGSPGNRSNFDYAPNNNWRQYVTLQLYVHAEFIRAVRNNPEFENHRLVPVESIGDSLQAQTSTDINADKRVGRIVTYELYNDLGEIDIPKSYDLAVFWKDYTSYDRIILWYDRFDPSTKLHCQIILETPYLSSSLTLSNPESRISTRFNGFTISSQDLLEILG